MKDSDIVMIGQALGIELPKSYKREVVPSRNLALARNTEHQRWDDANGLQPKALIGGSTTACYQSHSQFADWAEDFYRDVRSDSM